MGSTLSDSSFLAFNNKRELAGQFRDGSICAQALPAGCQAVDALNAGTVSCLDPLPSNAIYTLSPACTHFSLGAGIRCCYTWIMNGSLYVVIDTPIAVRNTNNYLETFDTQSADGELHGSCAATFLLRVNSATRSSSVIVFIIRLILSTRLSYPIGARLGESLACSHISTRQNGTRTLTVGCLDPLNHDRRASFFAFMEVTSLFLKTVGFKPCTNCEVHRNGVEVSVKNDPAFDLLKMFLTQLN